MHPSSAAIVSVHIFGNHPLHSGRGAAFVVLVAFLASFLAIRTSARLTRGVSWWPGGVQSGGVHLHHLVWGICMILVSGFIGSTPRPVVAHRRDRVRNRSRVHAG